MEKTFKSLIDFIFAGEEPDVDMNQVPDVSDEQLDAYFNSATIKCIE